MKEIELKGPWIYICYRRNSIGGGAVRAGVECICIYPNLFPFFVLSTIRHILNVHFPLSSALRSGELPPTLRRQMSTTSNSPECEKPAGLWDTESNHHVVSLSIGMILFE